MLRCEDIEIGQGNFHLKADFSFKEGVVTALVGPSGAGKSTLLATLSGFLTPISGRITYGAEDITAAAPGSRPISILFQDNNLFPHLTISQNVGLALGPRLKLTPEEKENVDSILRQVGLNGMGMRRPADLSGGQQSRAALARVLLANRPIVLLDEPFAALGPALKHDMLNLVEKMLLSKGRTVIMVTHDPDDARRIAEQTIVVADGRAAPPVITASLFANPPKALAEYLGETDRSK